ncbi:MAG: hypothetical protein LBN30_00990 [Oscillospiraceae bacterium]|jgi:hypothetical protein|nr:hypothetical protein [Oscillospiraceae bacterium]
MKNMNLKASIRYQARYQLNSYAVFYGIVAVVYIVLSILFVMMTRRFGVTPGTMNMDSATVIFALCTGLAVFKENFTMLQQNGVSRRTMFWGRVAITVVASIGMALADALLHAIFKLVLNNTGLNTDTLFDMGYGAGLPASLAFYAAAYALAAGLGYFIAIVFYRLPKLWKVLVGAGVPILLFVVLPLVDVFLLRGKISDALEWTLKHILGVTGGAPNPIAPIVSFACLAVAMFALAWATLRKAAVVN